MRRETRRVRMRQGGALWALRRRCLRAAAGMLCLAATAPPAVAQTPPAVDVSTVVDKLAQWLEELERRNTALEQRNQSLSDQVDALQRRLETVAPGPSSAATALEPLPAPVASSEEMTQQEDPIIGDLQPPASAPVGDSIDADAGVDDESPNDLGGAGRLLQDPNRFRVGDYDDDLGAFVLVRPTDAQRVPFELRFDLITQARYMNFAKSRDVWTDAAGQQMPIRNFNAIEVTRNFLVFSGFGIDPRLQYSAIIFSSTSIDDTVYLGWINYRFNRAFDLRVGNWLLPGTREWYESFRWTLGADRLMATTFFRPNISPGVWVQGEPVDGLNYVAMVANSLNSFSQGLATRVGSSLAFGGTVWWDPTNDFGVGVSDIEDHRERSYRFGTSVNIARQANQGFTMAAIRNPEDTFLRLSDGTPLFRPDVLGPGVELQSTNVQLWTIDAAMKHRGFGISGEYFLRWLNNFQTIGERSPYDGFFDHGGLLQAGYFIRPHKLEAFARTSFVSGRFGGGVEYGGGINWYPRGSRTWRLTGEALHIEGSPAQNFITGYRAGETGTLFQLQWLTDF